MECQCSLVTHDPSVNDHICEMGGWEDNETAGMLLAHRLRPTQQFSISGPVALNDGQERSQV